MENTTCCTNMFSNLTESDRNNKTVCSSEMYQTYIVISDILSIFIGQPVIAKLLWTTFHSKKKDILNINLALFHNIQYLLTTIHVCIIYFNKELNSNIVTFITVYLLIGGPLTLSFICLERYIAVVHPTFYPLLKKYRFREGCALSMWLLVLPTATIQVSLDRLNIESYVIDFMAYIVLFLTGMVMLWANIAILKALRTSGPASDKLHPAKKRAFQTVCGIAFIAMMCYSTVGGCVLFSFINGPDSICFTIPVIIIMVSVSSVAHPIFYLSTTGNLPCRRSPLTQKQHC